jgi:hypothetical protein
MAFLLFSQAKRRPFRPGIGAGEVVDARFTSDVWNMEIGY